MGTAESTTSDAVRVLIAEDSPTQAEKLRYTLERNGYVVTSTANGRLALEQARVQKPTLVISDIVMPEMDGYQLCHEIKSDPQLKDVPVILVTTLSDPQDVIRGLECRADNFIIKPYAEKYLLSRIQFVLLNYEMRKNEPVGLGVEIYFNGQRHLITADRLQILNLLLSTYEAAIQRNQELARAKEALHAANKELEAFSYSVSHDLRAPLRAIDGFTRIVLDDYGEQLGDIGKDYLKRAQAACQRMGQLIEDLLNLSRVARNEIQRERVDFTALAKVVSHELQQNQPHREVRVEITEGLVAEGDSRLLRAVLENLFGNAWKFTTRQPIPVIEFGMSLQNSEKIFFVRDNGAGFDMAYADKLFGAFQRLHSVDEFPGTGIGLATVQRIINRHGGRIWAQSKVNEGATFQFTL